MTEILYLRKDTWYRETTVCCWMSRSEFSNLKRKLQEERKAQLNIINIIKSNTCIRHYKSKIYPNKFWSRKIPPQ